jgi:glycosyltransferase involved in cell wall biosynthesis
MRSGIAYWTRFHEPGMEAVSWEIQALHDHFEGSRIYNVSREVVWRSSPERVDLPHGLYPLHAAALLGARKRAAVHAVSGSWRPVAAMAPFLPVPTVVTVTDVFPREDPASLRGLNRFTRVVVESEEYRDSLVAAGVDRERTAVILPGVDLSVLEHDPPRDGTFKLVFASAPLEMAHMEPRGVRILLEAVGAMEGVGLKILWRGRHRDTLDRLISRGSADVEVIDAVVPDVRRIYSDAHAAVVPYVGRRDTKLCPHSMIESLASGKPVLVTEDVAVRDLVRRERCGVVTPPTAAGLRAGIAALMDDYDAFQGRARPAAEKHFDLRRFLRDYEALYTEIIET